MLARHRCDKGVTAAGIVGDIAPARTAVAKRLTQRGDMYPQRALVDDSIGPGAGDQLVSRDGLAGAFDQGDQDVERTAAEPQRLSVVEQHPPRRDQPERSEGEGIFTLSTWYDPPVAHLARQSTGRSAAENMTELSLTRAHFGAISAPTHKWQRLDFAQGARSLEATLDDGLGAELAICLGFAPTGLRTTGL